MKTAQARRRGLRLLAGITGAGLIVLSVSPTASRAGAAGVPLPGSAGVNPSVAVTPSALTVHGRGAFAQLAVTVNQTAGLTNQPLSVTWSGAPPTLLLGNAFQGNFMAVMECWGDPSANDPLTAVNPGPSPTQCEAGGAALNAGRAYPIPTALFGAPPSATRIVAPAGSSTAAVAATKAALAAGGVADDLGNVFQPFVAVDGTTVNISENVRALTSPTAAFWQNPYFSYNDTNEIDFGRTFADGTGSQQFIAATGLEAPGLGCGQSVQPMPTGGTKRPQCWLVAVPQKGVDVSPVSAEAWANRVAIPLSFHNLDSPCTFGNKERQVAGGELASGAISSWQPTLCSLSGAAPFSYAALGDGTARSGVLSAPPGSAQLAVVTQPIDPTTIPDAPGKPVYAPLTLSAITVAFNIERLPSLDSKGAPNAAESPLSTTRVATLKLTPRLIAKLLTESYQDSLTGVGASKDPAYAWAKPNSVSLFTDRDFLQFNPEFALLQAGFPTNASQLVVEFASSDATSVLWQWIAADREAQAWLAGSPDPWGMTVNPLYSTTAAVNPTGVAFAPASLDHFPKSDPYCSGAPGQSVAGRPVPGPCVLSWSPYTLSLRDSGARTASTDVGSLGTANANALTADQYYVADGAQTTGSRVVLSVTDTVAAARYGLQTAQLSHAGDDSATRVFVAAGAAGIAAGEAAMGTSTAAPAVLVPKPDTAAAGAYPLTTLTYGVVFPALLDASGRADYSRFLAYGAGPGQVPGTDFGHLPLGYVPLPAPLRAQTLAASTAVAAAPAQTAAPTTTIAPPLPVAPTPVTPQAVPGAPQTAGTPSAGTVATPPVAAAPGAQTPAAVASPTTTTVAPPARSILATSRTPPIAIGAGRFALPALAVAGAAGGLLWAITRRRHSPPPNV